MNKYLMLGAAALLASAANATAAAYTFTFGTSGYPFCDGGILVTQDNGVRSAAWIHTNNNCSGGTSEGLAILTRVTGLGLVYDLSDTYLGKNYGIYSEQINYTVPAKPKNGSRWTQWIGMDGVTSFEGNFGALVDVTKGAIHNAGRGTKSTASVVRQAIAAHRRSAQ